MVRRAEGADAFDAGFGASPSGKAADFDSAIRRFEPSRPSQVPPSWQRAHFCNGLRTSGRYAVRLEIEEVASTIKDYSLVGLG